MLDFNGKVVFITGTSGHIAKASADLFVQQGATVIGADIAYPVCDPEDIAFSTNPVSIHLDVTDTAMIDAVFGLCEEQFGRIDIVVNAAGIGSAKGFLELTEEDWDRTLDINLKGVWLCMKYELQQMLSQGKGAIVNASSINGLGGWLDLSAYVASKHGVIGLTRSAALEYAEAGIRINAVCPGPVLTPLSHYQGDDPEIIKKMYPMPMGRRGTMEEVAEAVIWLCSDKSSYITGHPLVLDGGFMAQ